MTILFVCTGNTCRSCMAEAIFNKLCDITDVNAHSAGICTVKNSITSMNSVNILKEKFSIDLSERKAIQLTENMLIESNLILTMTKNIKESILNTFSNMEFKVFTLNEYIGQGKEVIDPYGEDISVYRNTILQLENSIILLLEKLKEDKSIF